MPAIADPTQVGSCGHEEPDVFHERSLVIGACVPAAAISCGDVCGGVIVCPRCGVAAAMRCAPRIFQGIGDRVWVIDQRGRSSVMR